VFIFLLEVIEVDTISVEIPEDLKRDIMRFPEVDWSKVERRAIEAKLFDLELERSRKLRRSFFEFLVSKSKLTEEDAKKLGDRINESMLKSLREEG